jgi:endonuclease/exonuclease/phosphatase family metal-dependent hydrolase
MKYFLTLISKGGKTMETSRIKKTIMVLGVMFFGLVLFSSKALAATAQNEAGVTIMTQNMDAGTDLGFVLGLGVPEGVDLTLAEIQASHIPERADLLAAKIVAEQPHLVGLQEATLWRIGPTPETATQTLYDQLELLLSALASRGVAYEVVAVNRLTDLALPGTNSALRYTDRDALLVRSDLLAPEFHISDTHTHIYEAALDFQGSLVVQGWISANVLMGNSHFRLVVTHLESPVPGMPEATEVQVGQASELIQSLRNLTIPVVVCGDFNSDANFGDGPDATPSVALIEAAGYADTWRIANLSDPGDTWPLFLEDQRPPRFFARSRPFERIDLFFSKGTDVISAKQVLAPASAGTRPSYGSDHAGVIATFQP